jgi:DNA-binding MarR family transcriptional regulator
MRSHQRARALDASVLHLLHRAGQHAEVMFTAEAGVDGLTPRQYAVLYAVANNEDISQTGLVDVTGIDRSTLADVVRRLVNKGHLARKRTRQDARMYAVRITAKGRQSLDAAAPIAIKTDQRLLAALRPNQREDFIACLSAIVDSLATDTA